MNKSINNSVCVLFKATRKFHRLQQTEFAAILGVTQGTISKVEAAVMAPDLSLWFNFLKSFDIQDPYCFTYVALELNDAAFLKLKTDGSPLLPTFDYKKDNCLCTVKKIRPLYDFLMLNHAKPFENFLKENKISKELFYILNHPLTSEFVDTFFSFLNENKINAKSVSLLNLNFEHSLGREKHELASFDSSTDIFSILNKSNENILAYEFDGTNGEYFINLNKKGQQLIHALENSELIMNYNFLYPFHVLKSTKNIKGATPHIHEVKKDQRWKVTYVS
jgi:DNA-binding XRE family transcriptional regulator